MEAKILLVEDDTSLGFVVSDQLKSLGYKVTLCMDGVEALKRFNEETYHMCIFDVMMPKKDGFTLATEIRQTNAKVPILFLTAKSMVDDKIAGFKAGGDDYLTKPFNFDELEMRVMALLKRVDVSLVEEELSTFQLGAYVFDSEEHSLKINGQSRSLTKKENQILKIMCKNANSVVPREVVLNAVWGQDDYFVGRSLDVFMTKIRKYLKEDESVQITNIHGVGFKLTCANV
ncbi:MAG: response regulator transcription factor [Crocinitomicaceae bacterium]|jgi:DNA-binding response OmpR family regulator|nr:response regulator transcription factor [Crocinitomicaceae bacterium]